MALDIIYFGNYNRTVKDGQYVFIPTRWRQSATIYFNLVVTDEDIQFLYCSDNKDSFSLVREYGNILTTGEIHILNEKKLFLPEEFLKYLKKKNQGYRVLCYGNIDHFEIWLPKELKHVEDNMDFKEIEQQLKDLGLELD